MPVAKCFIMKAGYFVDEVDIILVNDKHIWDYIVYIKLSS
jgi:hypothetical protein